MRNYSTLGPDSVWFQGLLATSKCELRFTPWEDAAIKGFNWTGVIVGHWMCGDYKIGKGGKTFWLCGSKCGVKTWHRSDELARGGPKTCEICRGGGASIPAHRIASEKTLDSVIKLFNSGSILVDVRSNLKGKPAVKDWEDNGYDQLMALVDRTGLGRDFGWKGLVRDCHEGKGTNSPMRVRAWRDGTRGVELSITGQKYSFDVDLAVGRTDKPWSEIKALIERAINPPGAVMAVTATTTTPAVANIDRLNKLRSGIDKAIAMQQDAKAGGDLLGEIKKRLDDVRRKLDPLRDAYERSQASVDGLKAKVRAAQELARDREAALTAAMNNRDEMAKLLNETIAARDDQAARIKPLEALEVAITAEHVEAMKMEDERAAQQAKVGDISLLLAALEKLGVSA